MNKTKNTKEQVAESLNQERVLTQEELIDDLIRRGIIIQDEGEVERCTTARIDEVYDELYEILVAAFMADDAFTLGYIVGRHNAFNKELERRSK